MANTMASKRIQFYISLSVLLWLSLATAAALITAPRYNSDASSYYTIALRVSRLQWWHSVDGILGPLLSWLIAIPLSIGLTLESSFRLVNLAAFALLLVSSAKLMKICQLTLKERLVALNILGTIGFFSCIAIITSDILLACISCTFYCLLCRRVQPYLAGLIFGCCYLAKAAALPILGISLLIFCILAIFHRDRTLYSWIKKMSVTAGLLCLLWITALSIKYNEPLISAQSLIAQGRININQYVPTGNPADFVLPPNSKLDSEYSISQRSSASKFRRTTQMLHYFWDTSVPLTFGKEAFVFLLILTCIGLLTYGSTYASLTVIVIVHTLFYLWIWGPYIRYYLPVLPIYLLFAVLGWRSVSNFLSRRSAVLFNCVIAIWTLSIIVVNLRACLLDLYNPDAFDVQEICELPLVRERAGLIVGDPSTALPALVAAKLKREYWQHLLIDPSNSKEYVRNILDLWQAEQLFWFKERDERLSKLVGFEETGPYKLGTRSFYLYTRTLAHR